MGTIDDATGEILALVVRDQEDMHGYMAMLGQILDEHGIPLTLYGDRFGALVRNDDHWSVEEQLAGRQRPTLFGQVLEELGVTLIHAHSPQAKGRVERMWETLQDRLVSELRLLGLTTLEQVAAYLPTYIAEHNAPLPPPPPPAALPRVVAGERRGQITNMRSPAPKHPWRRGYQPSIEQTPKTALQDRTTDTNATAPE